MRFPETLYCRRFPNKACRKTCRKLRKALGMLLQSPGKGVLGTTVNRPIDGPAWGPLQDVSGGQSNPGLPLGSRQGQSHGGKQKDAQSQPIHAQARTSGFRPRV